MGSCISFHFYQKHQRKDAKEDRFKSPLQIDLEEKAVAPEAEGWTDA